MVLPLLVLIFEKNQSDGEFDCCRCICFYWTLDVSQTASMKSLVHLSVLARFLKNRLAAQLGTNRPKSGPKLDFWLEIRFFQAQN